MCAWYRLRRLGGGLPSWPPPPPPAPPPRPAPPALPPPLAVPQGVRLGRAPRRKRRIDPLGARALRQRPPGDRLTAPPSCGGSAGPPRRGDAAAGRCILFLLLH